MARAFAAKGRDLALCALRTERLEELKTELGQRYPDAHVVTAALDVNDHDQVMPLSLVKRFAYICRA
jgi:NADP-dependent 3-hydroxy acid dehydrogenase YdfG